MMKHGLKPMPYTCRRAEALDRQAAARIIQQWVTETPRLGPLNHSQKVIEFWSGCFQHVDTSWVAEMNERVMGFCIWEDYNIIGLYAFREARGLREP